MAKFKVRYLRRKGDNYFYEPSKSMRLRGYWPEALGIDYAHALERAERLNAEWDIEKKKPVALENTERAKRGTIAWLIEKRKKTQSHKYLEKKTQREFEYYTGLLVKTREKLASGFERKHIRELYENMVSKKGYSKDKANRVIKWLRVLLSDAIEEGLRKDNPAFNLQLEHNPPRSEVWNQYEVAQFVLKATEMDRSSIGLAVMLAFDLGQRQGDIIKLSWNQYDGKFYNIRQGKTGARVAIPLLADMKASLDATPRKSIQIIISEETNRPYKADDFRHHFRDIANACGFKQKQFLDLRRSSVVRLSLAGCSPQLISSITGHSIHTVTQILKVYNPPTKEQAAAAITLLEAYMGKQKLTGVGI